MSLHAQVSFILFIDTMLTKLSIPTLAHRHSSIFHFDQTMGNFQQFYCINGQPHFDAIKYY